MRIFISYAHVDWQFIEKLANRLRRYHDVWFDERLHAGQDWWQAILAQLNWCECFVYVLSPESLASKYCLDEYAEARNLGKHIVPIRLQPNVDLPDTLQHIQYADFSTRRFEDALADLIGDLGRLELQARAQEAPPPVPQQAPSPPQEQIDHFQAFREAVEARQTGDYETALRLFNTLAQAAPDFLPEQVAGLIQHSQTELERQARRKEYDRLYKQVSLLTLDPFTLEDARQMWEDLQKDFPEIDDDPDELKLVFQRKVVFQREVQTETEAQRVNPLSIVAGVISVGLLVGILALLGVFGGSVGAVLTGSNCRSASLPGVACTGVNRNDGWTPLTQEFNGVEMALVPAGCFQMGSSNGDDDEIPVHEQCFDKPFWIDVYEVTNAQYGAEGDFSRDNRPRERVNWFDAVAHCENRGARLPTEAEWEYAARGPDNLIYPWGNDFEGDYVIWDTYETADVGSKPNGASWVGVLDMSGNVWEWVSSIYEDYPYSATDGREVDGSSDSSSFRVLRGGSWYNFNASSLRAAIRNSNSPDESINIFGFRCARSF